MEPILQSQIFFFITSIFVLVLTIVLIISGVYLIRILKNFSDISTTLKEGVSDAGEELAEMAEHVRDSALFRFIFGQRHKPHARRRHTPKS